MRKNEPAGSEKVSVHYFTFPDFNLSELSITTILKNSAELPSTEKRGFFEIQPQEIDINYASFKIQGAALETFKVVVKQNEEQATLYCSCVLPKRKLCEHQIQVLYNFVNRKDLRAFFDRKLRFERIKQVAMDYGLENEPDLDHYFQLDIASRELVIRPRLKELIPLSREAVSILENQLVTKPAWGLPDQNEKRSDTKSIVILGQNKYYEHFYLEMYEASVTKSGKLKNPLSLLNPLDQIWKTQDPEILKFCTAISAFHNNFRKKKPEMDLAGLKSILKNPLHLDFYYHFRQCKCGIAGAGPAGTSSIGYAAHNRPEREVFSHFRRADPEWRVPRS
jgi:hypothetical protein